MYLTRLAAIFLSIFYTPLGLYALYKAYGVAGPPGEDAGNAFWVGVGLISLLIAAMAVFALIRMPRPVDRS